MKLNDQKIYTFSWKFNGYYYSPAPLWPILGRCEVLCLGIGVD